MAGTKNSGRKTKKEEIAAAIELITEEALLNLAKSKVKKYLDGNLTFKQAKEMALPIVVKGMSQKLGGDVNNPLIIQVAKEIANKNAINSSTSTDS